MELHAGTRLQSFFFPSRNFSLPDSTVDGHFDSLVLNPAASKSKTTIVSVYFFLQIFGGHFEVPVILLTLLFKRDIQRHPLLVNFLVTWVLYTTAFCLLLYVGRQFGPEPPVGLCLSQASLIYDAAIMCSFASLAFVINIWLDITALNSKHPGFNVQKWRDYLLIAVPYILFVVFTIAMTVVGAAYPHVVTRQRYLFYCTIDLDVVDLVSGCSGLVMVCVVGFEILIDIRLYRMKKAIAKMKVDSSPPLNLVARVVAFSTYSILSLLACIGFWSQQGDDAPYIIQASLPTAAFVIFGSQVDLLRAWGVIKMWHTLRHKLFVPHTQVVKTLPPVPRSEHAAPQTIASS